MADTVYKARITLLNESGGVEGYVDPQTSADMVKFSDGETFQEKLDAGTLKGEPGETGPQGPAGEQEPKG